MAPPTPPDSTSLFTAPQPIRALFKLFPLRVHDAEPLPARAPDGARPRARLHVFSTDEDARCGRPSYNPGCLKWQTYLRIANLRIDLIPSTNHASPSGSLPYLLPASHDSRPEIPLTGTQIAHYAARHSSARPIADAAVSPRHGAYLSLLGQSIRPAWLHALYIDPAQTPLLSTLYLPPSSLPRQTTLQALRSAATAEILRTTRRAAIHTHEVYAAAEAAFGALSALLADEDWFSGGPEPGMFDAAVFAYTYLIGGGAGMDWVGGGVVLEGYVAGCANLVNHRRRLHERCWG